MDDLVVDGAGWRDRDARDRRVRNMHERRRNEDVRSGPYVQCPDVHGIHQLCTTGVGAVSDGVDPGMEPLGWQGSLAILFLLFGNLLVLVRACIPAGYGGGHRALLSVVPSRSRGDPVRHVVVKLTGHGLHGPIGGLQVRRFGVVLF